MSITIDISDEKLRAAEEALDIHDPTQLFLSLLDEKLASSAAQKRLAAAIAAHGDAVHTPEGAAQFLIAIGGTMPEAEMPRRRRVEDYL